MLSRAAKAERASKHLARLAVLSCFRVSVRHIMEGGGEERQHGCVASGWSKRRAICF